jgi:hypothetical protein
MSMGGAAFGIKAPICPRCLGYIPGNENPGEYPGATSRLTRGRDDDPVEICSECGRDEAMGNGMVPQSAWPIKTATSPSANAVMPVDSKHRNAGYNTEGQWADPDGAGAQIQADLNNQLSTASDRLGRMLTQHSESDIDGRTP